MNYLWQGYKPTPRAGVIAMRENTMLTTRTPLHDTALEVKARVIAAISSGTAVFMLFFLLLSVIFSSAVQVEQNLLQMFVTVGGLLFISLLVFGMNYLGHV